MLKHSISALAAVTVTAASAGAQFQQQQPYQLQQPYQMGLSQQQLQNFMPNIYNPINQPLSPSLNLLRGGNPAVNYYYGVRPGTIGGFNFGLGAPFTAGGGYRPLFFPQLANVPDPFTTTETGAAGNVFPPAGHPAYFNSTQGFFPSPFGNRGSGQRSGLSGVGTSRPNTTGR
jgi:hypothetical protein